MTQNIKFNQKIPSYIFTKAALKQQVGEIKTSEYGIVAKADSLGSLEALLVLLEQHSIPVIKAGIGPISKKDVYMANTLPEEDKIIIGFNIELSPESDVEELKNIKVITNPVVYKIIEDLEETLKSDFL